MQLKSPNVIEGNGSFNVEIVLVSLYMDSQKSEVLKGSLSGWLIPVMRWKMCSVYVYLFLRSNIPLLGVQRS